MYESSELKNPDTGSNLLPPRVVSRSQWGETRPRNPKLLTRSSAWLERSTDNRKVRSSNLRGSTNELE